MASDFDLLFQNPDELTRLESHSLSRVFERYGVKSVLDCAAGTGIQAIGLAEGGYDVSASDISDKMLKQLGRKAADKRLRIPTALADFRTLEPWKGSTFDAVICCGNSIPLVADLDEVRRSLRAMTSVTRLHGIGVVGLHNYLWPGLKKHRLSYRGTRVNREGIEMRVDFRLYDLGRVKVNYLCVRLGRRPWFTQYVKSYLLLRPQALANLMLDCGYKSARILDRRGFELHEGFDEFPLVVGET
ncbi:MAG: class I SAM-dependent methyltransferase [archaeon]|nr:MAG: class I SAM-dependent methyltransferase [archaeon]